MYTCTGTMFMYYNSICLILLEVQLIPLVITFTLIAFIMSIASFCAAVIHVQLYYMYVHIYQNADFSSFTVIYD